MGNVADEPLWSYYEGNKDNDCDGTAVFQGDLKNWDVAQATSFVSTVQRSARKRPFSRSRRSHPTPVPPRSSFAWAQGTTSICRSGTSAARECCSRR